MKKIIIIPGLGDNVQRIQRWTKSWPNKYGLAPIFHSMHWRDEEYFEFKLHQLLGLIDVIYAEGHEISIIGCSAGGSAALNALLKRPGKVERAINVCGRLRRGRQKGFRSFESRTRSSKSFAQSVDFFEQHEESLSDEERKRVMTVRPLFGDELVPADTVSLSGACNIVIPSIEHVFSIYAALTIFSSRLCRFLKDG